MKKFLAAIISLSLCGVMLAGCGGNGADNMVSDETTSAAADIGEAVTEAEKDETETGKTSNVSYSTNDESTVKNGNAGMYSYKSIGGQYDIYYIIDFDEGYVYRFIDGNGEETCDRVKIDSGDLNSVVMITYHDGDVVWSNGLHFKWKNQPDTLILQDSDGFETSFSTTNLNDALKIRDKKIIAGTEAETGTKTEAETEAKTNGSGAAAAASYSTIDEFANDKSIFSLPTETISAGDSLTYGFVRTLEGATEFYMDVESADGSTAVIMALSGKNVYMKMSGSGADEKLTVIIKDSVMYMLDDSTKSGYSFEADEDALNEYSVEELLGEIDMDKEIEEAEDVKVCKVEIGGKEYTFEVADTDAGFLFDGDELYAIFSPDTTREFNALIVHDFSGNVPAGTFDIPSGYEVVDLTAALG